MSTSYLRLHTPPFISQANGPGERLVVWMQGCTLACPGCFNPGTHTLFPALTYSLSDWEQDLASFVGGGITVSGGEPLQQPVELLEFLDFSRKNFHLTHIAFSGYTLEEIYADPLKKSLLPVIDVLIAGRFQDQLKTEEPLLGSANQSIHFLSDRIKPVDLIDTFDSELLVSTDGSVTLSGLHLPDKIA